MNRIALVAVITLVGGSLVLAAPAVAEDVEECADLGAAQACVVDARRGDPGTGPDECREYRGFTGANATHGSDVGTYGAAAGGEETCRDIFFGERRSERVFLETDGDGAAGSGHAVVEWYGDSFHNETTSSVDWETEQTRTRLRLTYWASGGFCSLNGFGHVRVGDYRYGSSLHGDCPSETRPPAPPNPGWGNATGLP